MKITDAYVAGFFDGEGCIGIYSRKDREGGFHLRTQITQSLSRPTTEALKEMVAVYGGNLSGQDRYLRKRAYNWQLNADKAAAFLRRILPHLIIKKEQAQIAVAWQESRPKTQRDAGGRIRRHAEYDVEFNRNVSAIVKLLKMFSVDEMVAIRPDMEPVLVKLRPLAVIKG
jgi:hypothetical protein